MTATAGVERFTGAVPVVEIARNALATLTRQQTRRTARRGARMFVLFVSDLSGALLENEKDLNLPVSVNQSQIK